jgi:hypothetical protein
MLHRNAVLGDLHSPVNWVFADVAARNAVTLVTEDLYKMCFVVAGGGAFYILTDVAAPTWVQMGGPTAALRNVQSLSRNANKSILNNTNTIVDWTTERESFTGAWTVGDPTKIVVPAGSTKVKVKAFASFGTGSTGVRIMQILKNAGNAIVVMSQVPVFNSQCYVETPWLVVVPTDYFRMQVYQTNGGALNLICTGLPADQGESYFEAEFR